MTEEQIRICSQQSAIDEIHNVIIMSLSGDNLNKMAMVGLKDIASSLNGIGAKEPLRISDSFNWLRTILSKAVMKSMYGKKNPMDAAAMEHIW